ncbi:MAG: hypothetical protein ACLGHL_02025 [Actinomycetota bacterium]
MQYNRLLRISCMLGALALVVAPLTSAFAEEAELAVSSSAWYWKSQKSQPVTDPTSGADVVTIEAPNPFCPSTSAGGPPEQAGTCKSGRLPVQVQGGDYDEPEMISAVAFDFALIPFGSTVKSFEATFLEANDEQSEPMNAEGKQLQACLVEQFFGDGEARQYKEAPRYTCSSSDPIAERKPVKIKNEDGETEERFQWTFDLTEFAQGWAEGTSPVAAIMLYPAEPKEADPQSDSNWRVVMVGPAEENGITTSLVYEPAEEDGLVPTDPTTTTGGGFDTGSTSTTDFGSGSTDTFGTGTAPEAPAGEGTEATEPVAVEGDQTSAAGALEDTAGSLPGYVWLAILVGLMGFSLVRSVVLEAATGIRPDGVLAQIRQINTERRGAPIAAAQEVGSSRLAGVMEGLKKLGGSTSGLRDKLPFLKRRG